MIGERIEAKRSFPQNNHSSVLVIGIVVVCLSIRNSTIDNACAFLIPSWTTEYGWNRNWNYSLSWAPCVPWTVFRIGVESRLTNERNLQVAPPRQEVIFCHPNSCVRPPLIGWCLCSPKPVVVAVLFFPCSVLFRWRYRGSSAINLINFIIHLSFHSFISSFDCDQWLNLLNEVDVSERRKGYVPLEYIPWRGFKPLRLLLKGGDWKGHLLAVKRSLSSLARNSMLRWILRSFFCELTYWISCGILTLYTPLNLILLKPMIQLVFSARRRCFPCDI